VNAREAMPGGGALRIRTRLVASDPAKLRHRGGLNPGAHAVLEVADTGHGMDPDTRTHAFEPFFTTREKGTGLGLSTVFGVVRQADGFIRVQSELGQGTTMQVHLPLSDAPAEAAGEAGGGGARDAAGARGTAGASIPAYGPSDDQGAAGARDPKRGTVLVADDEESVRRLFNRVLGRAGYRVLSAGDGPSALGLADTHGEDIDLLITDVSLPGMSGLALGTEFERRHPKVPVLYMSGYSEEDLIEQLRTRRGIAFLEKPFQIDELLGAVQGAMGGERRAS